MIVGPIAWSALTWAVSFGIGFGIKRHGFRHLCKEGVIPANRRKSMPWTTRPSHFSCAAMAAVRVEVCLKRARNAALMAQAQASCRPRPLQPRLGSRILSIRIGLRGVAGTDQFTTFRRPLRLRRPINASNSIDLAALPRRRAVLRRQASQLAARLWKRPKCKSPPSLPPSFTQISLSASTDCL